MTLQVATAERKRQESFENFNILSYTGEAGCQHVCWFWPNGGAELEWILLKMSYLNVLFLKTLIL